jgi:polyisoprenoid-binding protein YceI
MQKQSLMQSVVKVAGVGFLTVLILSASALAKPAKRCQWSADFSTFEMQWTAFKTTQKVGVAGSFGQVKVEGPNHHASLAALLKAVRANIQLSPEQIKTGNPARDETLYKTFFSSIKGQKIEGRIENVKIKKGTESEGTFGLKLTLNGKTKNVPFQFAVQDSKWVANGSIDVLDFGLQSGFEALHQACEVLHKGPDGVSKTWSQVDLKLTAAMVKACP